METVLAGQRSHSFLLGAFLVVKVSDVTVLASRKINRQIQDNWKTKKIRCVQHKYYKSHSHTQSDTSHET